MKKYLTWYYLTIRRFNRASISEIGIKSILKTRHAPNSPFSTRRYTVLVLTEIMCAATLTVTARRGILCSSWTDEMSAVGGTFLIGVDLAVGFFAMPHDYVSPVDEQRNLLYNNFKSCRVNCLNYC